MAEARDRRDWDQTACLLAAIANVWKHVADPADFHPYRHSRQAVERLSGKESMKLLHRLYDRK